LGIGLGLAEEETLMSTDIEKKKQKGTEASSTSVQFKRN